MGHLDVVDQVEDQQCPHAVVAETLPHFGEEENEQSLRVSEKSSLRLVGHGQFLPAKNGRLSNTLLILEIFPCSTSINMVPSIRTPLTAVNSTNAATARSSMIIRCACKCSMKGANSCKRCRTLSSPITGSGVNAPEYSAFCVNGNALTSSEFSASKSWFMTASISALLLKVRLPSPCLESNSNNMAKEKETFRGRSMRRINALIATHLNILNSA